MNFFKKQAGDEESREMKFGLARVIKYQELKKATNSFATELGRGGYGKVYLGKLRDGQMVAVKVLFDRDPKRLEHFFNEVTVLSRVRHKNLVSLCGCTNPTSPQLLLVYEYVPNGTVAEHLHGQQSALNWAARIQIAVETAEALAYLHGLEPPIIHRDVKTSNILLDHDFHAKVADMGICRLLPWDTEHVSTLPQGTMGYRDPEYDRYFRLSDKTDVYSFGVVLMELISGQQAVDVNRDPEDIYLDSMAIRKIIDHKLKEFVDPRLGYRTYNDVGRMINSMAQLAAECLQPTGNTRPSMVHVVTVLKEIQNEMEQLGLNDGTAQLGSSTFGLSTGSGVSLGGGGFTEGQILEVPNLRVFTLAELREATRNLRPDTLLGKGGSGEVFKGWVDEKTLNPVKIGLEMVIAVKRYYPGSRQDLEEWQSNIQFIKRLSHPSLVKLLGYCLDYKELLLAYEFMANGSLENLLFRNARFDPLSWDNRLKIAIGTAGGLAFLHSSENQFMYRDLKASKILLDANFNAKLSVTALEKYGPADGMLYIDSDFNTDLFECDIKHPLSCIDVYKAPEYQSTGRFYVKSDVYAFGVVLLEMLTGRRAFDRNRPIGEQNLVRWAKSYLADRRKLARLMDPRLEGQYPQKGAFQAALLTLKCLDSDHKFRPSMKEVVETLERIEALKDARKEHRENSERSADHNHGHQLVPLNATTTSDA